MMLPNLFIVSVKADSKNYSNYLTLNGYIIAAKDAQDFIRYGELNSVEYNNVRWSINNLILKDGKLNIEVFDGKEDNIFSGDMLLSYNQMDGKNFVADISNKNYKTLYFNICEVNDFKHYLTDKVSSDASLVWYLKDESENLYVFETNTNLLDTLAEELSKITETARDEIDTLWFIYNTEPVSSTIEEEIGWHEVSTYASGPSEPNIVWKGKTYTETHYFSSNPTITTCMPYVEVIKSSNVYQEQDTPYTTNLYIYQRVTENGVDITGRIGNVFKLTNITYKLGVTGNLFFYRTKNCYQFRYINVGNSLLTIAKNYAPNGLKTINEIIELMKIVMSSGKEYLFASNENSTPCCVLGGSIDDKYYIAYDSEEFSDYVGIETCLRPYNTSFNKNTYAFVRLEWSFDVVGGSVNDPVTVENRITVLTNVPK